MSSTSEATDEDVRRAIEEMELREYGEVKGPTDRSSPNDSSTRGASYGGATDEDVKNAVEKMEAEDDEDADDTMFSFSDV